MPETEFLDSMKNSISQNETIIKYLQGIKKGWQLKDKTPGRITSFLKEKLSTLSSKRINELVKSIGSDLRKNEVMQKEFASELYNETEDETIRDNLANILSTSQKDYFNLANAGRLTEPAVYWNNGNLTLIMGRYMRSIPHSLEFTRKLDGTMATSSVLEVQEQSQFKTYIEQITKQMNAPTSVAMNHRYESRIQTNLSNEEAEIMDVELLDFLSKKYKSQIERNGNYVTGAGNGSVSAVKHVMFKPDFFHSTDKHPRRVASKLIEDVLDHVL